MLTDRRFRCALAGLLLLAGGEAARAQDSNRPEAMPGWWFVPSIRTSGVREDNLLFTGESRAVGSFLRLTPSFETRHRHPLRTLTASYTFDSELHSQAFNVLDDVLARQSGLVRFDANPNPRSAFSAQGRYTSTRRPEEVLDQIGLVTSLRRTTSYNADASFDRELTPRTRGRLGYGFNLDDYGPPTDARPSARSTHHALSSGTSFRLTPRTALGVEYTGKLLIGEDLRTRVTARGTFWSNTVALRLTHSITPRVTAVLLAGPRLSQVLPEEFGQAAFTPLDWELRPELLGSLTYRRDGQLLSMNYVRSAFQGYGASGFIDTESVGGRTAFALGDRVQVLLRPAMYRNTLRGLRANSYRLDGAAAVQVSRWVSVEATYLYKRQDRSLTIGDLETDASGRPKTRNSIMLGVTLRRPIRLK